MYTFIHFKRKRLRDRDGGVKKEEERDQRWREKLQFTYLGIFNTSSKQGVCADGNVFPLLNISRTDSLIVFSQHSRLQPHFSALTNMIRCTIHDRKLK